MFCSIRKALFTTLTFSIFICIGSCTHGSRKVASQDSPLHLVIDIDWTLVLPLKEGSEGRFKADPLYLEIQGKPYLIREGMIEVISIAHKRGIKISFYSGGKRDRNINLLSQINIPTGESLLDLGYKVLSFDDLVEVSKDPQLRFSERLKKDLSKVDRDISKVILLEDIPHFAKGDGVKQTLWLGETRFPVIPEMSLEESSKVLRELGVKERYLPSSSIEDWWSKRKAFLLAAELEREPRDAQSILINLERMGFKDNIPTTEGLESIEKSPSYIRFLKSLPCPRLRSFLKP